MSVYYWAAPNPIGQDLLQKGLGHTQQILYTIYWCYQQDWAMPNKYNHKDKIVRCTFIKQSGYLTKKLPIINLSSFSHRQHLIGITAATQYLQTNNTTSCCVAMPHTAQTNTTSERLRRIQQSPHYRHGVFENDEPTEVMLKGKFFSTLNEFFHKPATVIPSHPLPAIKTDLKNLPDEQPVIVWFGHSSYLIRHKGFTVLVDPLFQSHASPVRFFGKPFPGTDIYHVADLPDIDLLILTHDHYDHLSFLTVKALQKQVKMIVTSLGVGAILEAWGIPSEKITELDWNETFTVNEAIRITAQTARHFSGRTLRRNKTVWSAFVLAWHQYRIFIGGDSGYGKHFKTIGQKHGPFDLALLECGQYGKNWPYIHMWPEETAQAANDLQASLLLPVHWAKFNLAMHPWNEPIERLLASPFAHQLAIATPKIGEPFWLGKPIPQEKWWR